jgi:hypothetical protein
MFSLLMSLAMSPALAFTEDLCFTDNGSSTTIGNCYHLDTMRPPCAPDNFATRCIAQAAADTAAMLNGEGRSTLHVDVTYLLAQVAGFDAETAHVIAAYDEATDTVQYDPRGIDGRRLLGSLSAQDCVEDPTLSPYCAYVTIDMGALNRLDRDSSGAVLHYGAVVNPRGLPPYAAFADLDPAEAHDPHDEVVLAHWQSWALGERDNVCAGGLTDRSTDGSYALEDSCYAGDSGTSFLVGTLPLLGTGAGAPINVRLEEQIFRDAGTLPELTASGFDAEAGAFAPYARFGIYLHLLQDRVSHHWCHEYSRIDGPAADDGWDLAFDAGRCAATVHGLRHGWETGYVSSDTAAAVALTWDALADLAVRNGLAPGDGEAAVADLIEVLEVSKPLDRIDALQDAADALGVCRLPGHGNTLAGCPL